MIAKCGDVRVPHWAHKGHRLCDPWWENETEWHRVWKSNFPAEWQEFIQSAPGGERHIADVMTGDGWVIEFQHSHITVEERHSREDFHGKLIWVVDGTRRKRDVAQVIRAWKESVLVGGNAAVRKVFLHDCRLLQEWAGSSAPIFVDIGEMEPLLWVFAKSNGSVYIHPFSRALFIEWHRGTATEAARQLTEFVTGELPGLIAGYESQLRARSLRPIILQPQRSRRRFRF